MSKLVSAGAAGVVLVTVLVGCAQAGTASLPAGGSARGVAERTASGVAHGPSAHELVARRKVESTLAQVAVLPGGRAVRRAPVAALERPPQTIGSPNVVRATRWWTAPGTVSAALGHLGAQHPAGLRASGSGAGLSPGTTVRSLIFDGHPTDAYSELILVLAVTRLGGGVAVRADAEALWLPRRTVAEHVDASVRSVDVTVTREAGSTVVHRTFTGRLARALADAVNRLPVRAPGVTHCPLDLGDFDLLVFHVDGPDVVVRAETTGCATVQVRTAGHSQPALQGGTAVARAVGSALGSATTSG